MNVFMILISLVLSNSYAFSFGSSAEDFTKNTFIGKTMKDVKVKYKSPYMANCTEKVTKLCLEKFSEKCDCYEVPVYRERDRSQSVYLDFHKGVVVNHDENWGNTLDNAELYMKPVKEFSGSALPNEIYDGGIRNGWQTLSLKWIFGKTYAAAVVSCPLEKFGGEFRLKKKLRECYLKASYVSTIDTYPKLHGTKINADY